MKLTVMGSFLRSFSLLVSFSGGFILWQMANQASQFPNNCYTFPAGTFSIFGFILSPYQGSCPFNSLPFYYAGDIALLLVVIGGALGFISVRKKKELVLE